ncbi:MAG: aspartate kinase [Flavobacteriales bacterium]|nr:aspartate kinase [Flavobacteriales bacterium]MDW8409349.1 aspartate kinase [Flavobacteriales bacterium]
MRSRLVFKFGGASVRDAQGIRNITTIVQRQLSESPVSLACVVSATGKTTNALEEVLRTRLQNAEEAHKKASDVVNHHRAMWRELEVSSPSVLAELDEIESRLHETLNDFDSQRYEEFYDRLVSEGERLSTCLVAGWWEAQGLPHRLVDARELVRTGLQWREGEVDWPVTERAIRMAAENLWNDNPDSVLLTQGFIGGGPEHQSVTLGREGSDYSAALLAAALMAESLTIWKDVAGVFNTDPKRHPDAVLFTRLSYEDAMELACYGATVIHPKTLFPLRAREIPMYVKSFMQPEAPGTRIDARPTMALVPSLIYRPGQALWHIKTYQGHFIKEDHLAQIFTIAARHRLKLNALQHTAQEVNLVMDDDRVRLPDALVEMQEHFRVEPESPLTLITMINYSPALVESILAGRKPLLEQRNLRVARFVVAEEVSR